MNEASDDQKTAMLDIVDVAYNDIVDTTYELSPENAFAAKEVCQHHVDNIGMVAGFAGYEVIQHSTEKLSPLLESATGGLTTELATQVVSWVSDVMAYIDSPDDREVSERLLNLGAEANSSDDAEVIEITQNEQAPEEEFDSPATETFSEDEASQVQSGILGILIEELQDIEPALSELALTISNCEDANELSESISGYRNIVSRVSQVARELELKGLVLIGNFVEKNLSMLGDSPTSQRIASLEVLQGWISVIIKHLQQPMDDALCIDVIDYLEKENWPEPLAYREQRDLIEGLTKELEVSGDFEIEARETSASPEDVALELSADAGEELLNAFFAESPGHAEKLSALVEAIANGENIQANVEAAQRIAHTLKGSGNLVGARGIANLSHHIEDIFEYIAKNHVTPPPALALTMQEAADTMEAMLEFLQGMADAPDNAQSVLQEVLDWANRIDSGNLNEEDTLESPGPAESNKTDAQSEEPNTAEIFDENRRDDDPGGNKSFSRRATDTPAVTGVDVVRVPTEVLDNIFRIVGETAIAIGQIREQINRLESDNQLIQKNDVALQQRRYELENLVSVRAMASRHRSAGSDSDSGFDPLEMDEYDEFYGVTHSYIEGVADSRAILRGINDQVSELNSLFLQQQRLNKELQQVVMTTRMVPVRNVSARLQRAVRQACRSTGKSAILNIIGEDLLLDGEVLSTLTESLMHMLRNSVDHSIEGADSRFDKGKESNGEITLSFVQEGNNVVVTCVDDGRGLDYDRIRERAIKQGLIGEDEAIDNRALARIVLRSGFSTSDKVTQVSGRGVGMDVVNNTIQSLNGSMDIGDAATGGTQISLRLPMTLLTSHCLIVRAEEELFAIPTSSLSQILSPGTGTIGHVGGKASFQLERDVYPVVSLNSMVGHGENLEEMNNSIVLLVQTADGMSAITVDQVVSSYDLVVKGMGDYIKNLPGIAGVSTLSDGSVVSVLDLISMMRSNSGSRNYSGNSETVTNKPETVEITQPKVLVVDDSLSVRNSLSQLILDGGFEVLTARDGLEAVDVLDKEDPDIVLTDLEMPRMNGLELVSYIRNSYEKNTLPVVMITSRTMSKHRNEAESVGVNQYITKPYAEDDVLVSISEMLAAQ